MAIYEFKCEHCGKINERSYRMSAEIRIVTCDKCGGDCFRIMSVSVGIVHGHNAANGYSKESEGL